MLAKAFLKKKISFLFLLSSVLLTLSTLTSAQSEPKGCDPWAAKIVSLEGSAQIQSPSQVQWRFLAAGEYICPGERLKILDNRAALELPNQTIVRVKAGSSIHFIKPKQSFLIELFEGALHFITRTPKDFKVKGPFLNAAIHGTEFLFEAEKNVTRLSLFEGQVTASNLLGQTVLNNAQRVEASAATPPQLVPKVKLRNAVQWAMYYPPVLASLKDNSVSKTLNNLNNTPQAQRDSAYYNQLASLALYQGKVQEARHQLVTAQAFDGATPTNQGNTQALLAIIELITGDTTKAKTNANAAIVIAPNASAPWLALSYIQQAEFELEKAQASAEHSVALAPNNALAKARLAELALALGHYRDAVTYAQQAAELNPELSRVQMILGFTHLGHFDLDQAQQAFIRASQLDPSDPLPQLGLGLVEIRLGHLTKGRRLLELAAILDPGNALIRSYLGKAYYEEQRNPLAATQFMLAKGLDPKDPTPWYYDALRKQSDNNPLGALEDLDQSNQLNDHRAVYRSRFLLDKDDASRSTNQASIYQSLNYDEISIQKSAQAALQAPSEHSAHRQLALAYAKKPLYEDLRTSERLKATLLQPIGTQPLPLGLDESGLITIAGAGPSDMGLNEFNPLFTQHGLSAKASALKGTDNPLAYQWQLGGFYKKGALSVSQYHYQSDGFRVNNDVEYTISSLFGQFQVLPGLELQMELKRREDTQGDLAQRFSDTFVFEDLNLEKEVDSARIGLKKHLTPSSSLLASFENEQLDRDTTNVLSLMLRPGFTLDINTDDRDEIQHDHSQLLYLNTHHAGTLSLGGGIVEMDRTKTSATLNPLVSPAPMLNQLDEGVKFQNYYLYQDAKFFNKAHQLIAGISYTNYETDRTDNLNINEDHWNPKLGYSWQASEKATFRTAVFKTHSAPDEASATLEPTHLAGFAQVFDDKEAAESQVYGLALDFEINPRVTSGLQLTEREIDVDIIIANLLRFETLTFDESLYTWYLNTKLTKRWSLASKYIFEKTKRQFSQASALLDVPVRLETHILPLSLNYNSPKGFDVEITGSFVRQKITSVTSLTFDTQEESDPFFNVDVTLKYKLPNRVGEVSLGVKNLFDEQFNLEDRNIQNNDNIPRAQRFYGERIILAKVSLNF